MMGWQRWLWRLLAVVELVLALGLFSRWLCVGTFRFYVDERTDGVRARQRFDLHDGRVVPQILASEGSRLSFPLDSSLPSRLRLRAVPASEATLEIALVEAGARRTLYSRVLSQPSEVAERLPATRGSLELSTQGELRLSDPRVVQDVGGLEQLLGLLGLGLLTALWAVWARIPVLPAAPAWRRVLLGALTAAFTLSLCGALLEGGLRALGDRLPGWVVAQRRDLGEDHQDPRWAGSSRYGPRLAARVHAVCEWQHGDIVRMGFLAPGLARHPSYRFALDTDSEGFRNAEPLPPRDVVAALGDSFTDAMTLPAELAWPSRLSARLGLPVRNYGTAGFGPGQELLVLKEYVLPRRPRLVVVAFFAGNDLQDAERFDTFQREGAWPASGLGWKFKRVVARFDQLYLTSLYQGLLVRLGDGRPAHAGEPPLTDPGDYSGDDPAAPVPQAPRFERGLFSLPVQGRALRFAFLPPYLNALHFSREELSASRRWELTRRAYREMASLVRAQGGELVVMLIPSKAQVYLPLVASSFGDAELRQALGECLREQPNAPGPEELLRHRLALNGLMAEFCASEGLALLDLTAGLQAQVEAGRNLYFPDDSHWNAAGQEAGAQALAGFLRERGLAPAPTP